MNYLKTTSGVFCLLLLIFLSSCQTKDVPAEVAGTTPEAAFAKAEPCNQGQSSWFPMDPIIPAPDGATFGFDAYTGPYTLGSCACDIEEIRLEFTHIPNPQAIKVYSGGVLIDPSPQIVDNVIIIDANQLEGGQTEILVYMELSGDDELPSVVSSGGLCIIDNLDALHNPIDPNFVFDPNQVHTSPAVIDYPVQGGTSRMVLVPTTITTQVTLPGAGR